MEKAKKGYNKMEKKFSVIMSIYKNDNPKYLRVALESVCNQTLKPNEIVLIGDGPVPVELERIVEEIKDKNTNIEVNYYPQSINHGLGEALRLSVEKAKYNYLARMDSDDISLPDRFEKQMKCFEEDNSLSIVGGMITEFENEPSNIVDRRILPLDDKGIKKFMRSRCGVNHVTVIFKKADLMKAGNYRSDYRQEDYFLWARMMKVGCVFKNIPDIVVNVRSGRDQFARRGGRSYFRDHMAIFRYMYHEGLISFPRLVYNYIVRGAVQFMFPNWLRTIVYQKMLRK